MTAPSEISIIKEQISFYIEFMFRITFESLSHTNFKTVVI